MFSLAYGTVVSGGPSRAAQYDRSCCSLLDNGLIGIGLFIEELGVPVSVVSLCPAIFDSVSPIRTDLDANVRLGVHPNLVAINFCMLASEREPRRTEACCFVILGGSVFGFLRNTALRCASIDAIGPRTYSASSGSVKRGGLVYSPSVDH